MGLKLKREHVKDSEAEWSYTVKEGEEEKTTTWGQWTRVLTYPVGGGKLEGKGPLGAKFGNFTSFDAFKSAMHKTFISGAGVYEWRVVLVCADHADFAGKFVFYCGKAGGGDNNGLHKRVREESHGKQGGGKEGMNGFFDAVLAQIEGIHTDAKFSVEFQARSSAIKYEAKEVEDDRERNPEDRKGYFPCMRCEIPGGWIGAQIGGCSAEQAEEEKLLKRFDYAACKTNNNQYRLKDFQDWLAERFEKLPSRVVVGPALTNLDIGLPDDAVKNILAGLRHFRVNDCDEIAEVLKIALLEAYKKGRADALGEVTAAVKELEAPQVTQQVTPPKPPRPSGASDS